MAMTSLHASIGMVIVTIIPDPLISIPLAFLSHFILDLYPEWYGYQTKINKKGIFCIGIEVLLSILIILFLINENNWLLLFGALSANLVDISDTIYYFITKKFFWFCHKNNYQGFGMGAIQTGLLDLGFVLILLGLMI